MEDGEQARLSALRSLDILDSPAEAVFDALVTLAARACGTPISLLTFLDADRQWFKARVGFPFAETRRELSFCAHALDGPALLEVRDATADPRFAENELVTGDTHIRFYAGARVSVHGVPLGALCVLDTVPRTLTAEQRGALADLATIATAQLEARLGRVERKLLAQALSANEELAALVAVTDDAISTLDLDPLLETLVARLVHVMKADAGALLLVESGVLVVRATYGFAASDAARLRLPVGEGFGGRIAATNRPRYIADARSDPEVWGPFLKAHGIVSMLGVPLRHGGDVIGVLHVDWLAPHPELPREMHLLEITASRAAAAIVNARLYDELRAANAAAERVRERLSLALAAADLGVWDWDVRTEEIVWDVTNERIFGLPPGGFDGRMETFRELVHPDDRARIQATVEYAMVQGTPYAAEFRVVRPDGEVRWLAARGHFQRSPSGAPLRLLGVTDDVTEARRAQEEREDLLDRERAARRAAQNAETLIRSTNDQLRALTARLTRAREEEALRISREIHDELGQLLTALRLDAAGLRARVLKVESPDRDALAARAESIADLAQKTITTVQRISEELRPGVLDQLGLEAALSGLLSDVERRTGISTTCRSTLGERRLDPHVETNVFRIAQELVTNVVRHSGARSLLLEVALDDGTLRMRVADDGRGITADELVAARSIGLVGLRERAILLGGSATLRPLPGGGTEAVVVAPAEVRA